jgi:mannosyltransferase OCH1-like enzyme
VIPKSIMQYWEGPLNKEVEELLDSWRKLNPEYKYELFNRSLALKYLERNYDCNVVSAFSSALLPAMQSDIFRITWLLKEGGIYIDAATKCISPIDELITNSIELILLKKWHGKICNGFIASKSKNFTLKAYLAVIIRNVLEAKISNVWISTGPGALISIISNEDIFTSIDQVDSSKFFLLINDLPHKKEHHWSNVQKNQIIYSKDDSYLLK